MRRFIVLMTASLAVVQLGWAQGEGQDQCNVSASCEDHSCNGTAGCGGTTNACESVTFQVPCDQDYHLKCEIVCYAGPDPTDCNVRAVVCRVSDNAQVGLCEIQDEQSGECTDSPHTSLISLHHGVDYKLIVCLDNCPNHTCDCTNCYARARVY